MSKKRSRSPVPKAAVSETEYPAAPLKKQDPYSRAPWKPGEVPARTHGEFIIQPFDATPTPYGHGFFGIEKPTNRGKRVTDDITGDKKS